MIHKMRIHKKYIKPIVQGEKTKEYRLYDEFRKEIKVGDTLLLAAGLERYDYVRVEVKRINTYKTWEEALEDSWEEQFSYLNIEFDKIIKECKAYYSRDDVEKYGIVVFDIKPIKSILKGSRVLIDTNTIIYRESHLHVNFEVSTLYKWFDKLKMTKLIHPITKDEISKYSNKELRKSIISKLNSYQEVIPNEEYDKLFETVVSKYSNKENSLNDNKILFQVYTGISDYLVTNDKTLINKAYNLYLSDKVFSISDFLKVIEDDNPALIEYKMLSVKKKRFGELDLENKFFNSLREDYDGFNNWFLRKNNEEAYVFESKDGIKGFLYLKSEDINEDYSKFEPTFTKRQRLKIGTFKIERSGFRLGERFLKIIFDNAIEKKVDEVYVTMFEEKRKDVMRLREFMEEWGFVKHGYDKKSGEIILVKSMKKYKDTETPKFNFPNLKPNPRYFILPILSEYHTDLFPDSILKNEEINLYKENLAHRYAIEKIYISSAAETPSPGDIIIIYRMGELSPKKYRSVITGTAIVENIISPNTEEEYLNECSNKSVFKKEELKQFYNEKKWRKVIKLLYYKAFDKKINLDGLHKMNVIESPKGPRPFTEISKDIYDKIVSESMVSKK